MKLRFQHIIRVAFLALWVLAGFRPFAIQAAPQLSSAAPLTNSLEATNPNIPSWESLGLEDLLVAPNQCSMSAPQTGSAHGGSDYRGCDAPAAYRPIPVGRHLRPRPQPPTRSNDYYLYFLYRLRL